MRLPLGKPLVSLTAANSATQEDELGQLYLSNVDFLKNGVPASIVATFVSNLRRTSGTCSGSDGTLQVVATVGYVLMKVVGQVSPLHSPEVVLTL